MDNKQIQYYFEDLCVGMAAEHTRVITEDEVSDYARISGDLNPIHLDEEYARSTPFNGRIVHGFLTVASVSAIFGMKLPGPGSIYVSQDFSFKAPVRIGDMVTTKVVVIELIPNKKMAVFSTTCFVEKRLVVDGKAILKVPSKPSLE